METRRPNRCIKEVGSKREKLLRNLLNCQHGVSYPAMRLVGRMLDQIPKTAIRSQVENLFWSRIRRLLLIILQRTSDRRRRNPKNLQHQASISSVEHSSFRRIRNTPTIIWLRIIRLSSNLKNLIIHQLKELLTAYAGIIERAKLKVKISFVIFIL